MKNYVTGAYFCGNEISTYGQDHGYVDYATLAKSFDAVMANDIIAKTADIGYWEVVNGDEEYVETINGDVLTMSERDDYIDELDEKLDNEEITQDDYDEEIAALDDIRYKEYFQYYIISENGYNLLSDYTNETVWYNEELDLYVWGVDHWGTSWDYVLTDIRCNYDPEAEK